MTWDKGNKFFSYLFLIFLTMLMIPSKGQLLHERALRVCVCVCFSACVSAVPRSLYRIGTYASWDSCGHTHTDTHAGLCTSRTPIILRKNKRPTKAEANVLMCFDHMTHLSVNSGWLQATFENVPWLHFNQPFLHVTLNLSLWMKTWSSSLLWPPCRRHKCA